ncbi:hypothetical protein K4749_20000 [Streptomyces sp. TRM72054]|uniref:hypothetical protein n=1 Tax=Streptomyces sp. TRM72054 TaxID=2870562 RepID=UPI001C8B14F8|nr:hypothetical protein [Streptomyces sp. TRM72054]MBX9395822.1 hypothetical protein [Streptomyces sp. TRM72054]
MTPTEQIEAIAFDADLSVTEKSERINGLLAHAGSQGVSLAVECLMDVTDVGLAEYLTSYLELVPDSAADKVRAAERLRGSGAPVQAAARLVPWFPESLADAFVQDYLAAADPQSPLASVVFSLAVHHPDRVRPHADRIDIDVVRPALLSGAPDELADALLDRWREERDLDDLQALALIRTPHAADLITSVRDDVDDPEDWEWLMPLAGRLPDTGASAGYGPALMGFVADKGAGPHIMGGEHADDVPLCARCRTPAERVLSLSAAALPQKLTADPSFFWFTCDCDEVDVLTVGFTPDRTHVYFSPQGPAAGTARLVPGGERSMVLEQQPNQVGVSMPAIPGRSQHQVGGLPRWPSPETHPICPECGNFMPFLAAMDSGPTVFGPMGFEGLLFGFWCDSCSVSTTRIQY